MSWRPHRLTPDQRGVGYQHRLASEQVIRTAICCAVCGHPFTAGETRVRGHVIPRSQGGTSTPDNYQAECGRCSNIEGQRLATIARNRRTGRQATTPRLPTSRQW